MAMVFKIGHKINVQNGNTQRRIKNGFFNICDLDVNAAIYIFSCNFVLAYKKKVYHPLNNLEYFRLVIYTNYA